MNFSWKWILGICAGLLVMIWIMNALENRSSRRNVERQRQAASSSRGDYSGVVGVGRSAVTSSIDLSGKLDPSILPDLFRAILEELAPTERPDTEAFQKKVVQTLSQRIMEDPDINYRVDLNEDGNMDPVLVVPEAVDGEAAVYSIRVPDPEKFPKDPTASTTDWAKIAEEGVELCALSATFNEQEKSITVDAAPNGYLYGGGGSAAPTHYRETYASSGHNWMQTYFAYRLFSDVLFGPRYGWYGPGWYGGWYGGFYGGWHRPVVVRNVTRTQTRYRKASNRSAPMTTRSGRQAVSSASRRTTPPSFVRRQASSASRQTGSRTSTPRTSTTSTRASTPSSTRTSTSRPSTSSSRSSSTFRSSTSRSSSYRGGGFSFGK